MDHPSAGASLWIDGSLQPLGAAALDWNDLAFTRGYAAFEAIRVYAGKPFLLGEHLDRLDETCAILGLNIPFDRAKLAAGVQSTIAGNGRSEALVRLYVTGGAAPGFAPAGKSRVAIFADPPRGYSAVQYTAGLALATTPWRRPLPRAKSTDYIVGIRETVLARKQGFDEVAYRDEAGGLLEGTTFSIVAVRGRELLTPIEGVLRGITLEHTLSLAQREGLAVRRAAISAADLAAAEELFITSTTREIMPVARVGSVALPTVAGPITRLLQECYRQSLPSP